MSQFEAFTATGPLDLCFLPVFGLHRLVTQTIVAIRCFLAVVGLHRLVTQTIVAIRCFLAVVGLHRGDTAHFTDSSLRFLLQSLSSPRRSLLSRKCLPWKESLATAILFASKGSNVAVCGRDTKRVEDAVKQCEEAGKKAGYKNKVISVTGDISDPSVIKQTVDKTVAAFGGLHVLVSNHGINIAKGNESLETWTQECFDQSMNINVASVISLIKHAMPHLEKVKGNVVCVSSMGSTMPLMQNLNYLISKAAVDHVIRCLALQLGPKGVRINAINPTYVATRLSRDMVNMDAVIDAMGKLAERETPLQGQFSGPEEQAEVILFLASDSARMVHGQCIPVDGGIGLKGAPTNFPALMQGMFAPQK
ncbi:hypothetical protein RRG08_044374 [Elysia crispata]|uniref:Uncharacterized protein n=1 Tax=Elysia crispata TaxID=231223 RepID=A0AAE1D1Z2_9GAST|nr:hypothetical protein RRG08_044374 [Elysia crispata]